MNLTIATTLRLALRTLFPALLLAAPAAADGPVITCADSGHCSLPRWVPDDLTPDAGFGQAVAVDDTLAAIGAPGADKVYIFRKSDGQWQLEDVLESPHGPGARFGATLEMNGTKLIVGAPQDDLVGIDAGAAHLYTLEAGVFELNGSFTSEQPEPFGYFGTSVSVRGFFMAVGEPNAGAGGRVTTYRQNGDHMEFATLIELAGTGALGQAVDFWGTLLVMGDPLDDTLGSNSGAVHFGVQKVDDTFQLFGTLHASDPDPGDQFGWSLELDEERLIVGAYTDDELAPNAGAAYIFSKEYPGVPSIDFYEIEKLLPCEGEHSGFFGYSVDIDGDRAVVGAYTDDTGGFTGGKAYTFHRGGIVTEAWLIEDQLRAWDAKTSDWLGRSVAVSGDQVLVGASGVDAKGPGSGAGYLFSTTRDLIGGGECPCDTLAELKHIGSGKAGILGVPELTLSKPLVPGEMSVVKLAKVPEGSTPILFWGLDTVYTSFDHGTLYVDNPYFVLFPTVSNFEQVGLPAFLAPTPSLCDCSVTMQAMVLDPIAFGPYGTSQSKGLFARIGY